VAPPIDVTGEDWLVDLADELQACLEPRADEMAALVEELVAVDTENPPGRGSANADGCCTTPWREWGFRTS